MEHRPRWWLRRDGPPHENLSLHDRLTGLEAPGEVLDDLLDGRPDDIRDLRPGLDVVLVLEEELDLGEIKWA